MNDVNSPIISIIVPVYNATTHLDKMINSIIYQTYKDWELLLINDGSIDNSLEICQKYSEVYKNIFTFSQKNKGVSAARNLGINKARGKYICFVDSDDWVDDNYLEVFINHMDENTMIVQDYKRILDNGNKIIGYNNGYNNEIFRIPKDINKIISEYKFIQGYPWNKLFIRKLIIDNQIYFIENINLGEDEIFYYEYLKFINKIIFINHNTYNYRASPDSLTSKNAKFPSEFLYCLECNKFYHHVLKINNSKDNQLLFQKKFSRNFNHLLRTILYWEGREYTDKEKIRFLKKMYSAYYNSLRYLKGDSLVQKIEYFLFRNKLFILLHFILKMRYN